MSPTPFISPLRYKQKVFSPFSYFAVPVVSSGFVELLSELEGDLSVFEGALGADGHLVALLADDDGWFGHITNLPGGEAHT